MIYIINSAVLTSFGTFEYKESTVKEIKSLLTENDFKSVIGHEATADLLTSILGLQINFNRENIVQCNDDLFIVFKPKNRLEYKEYSIQELSNIEYDLGILKKIN